MKKYVQFIATVSPVDPWSDLIISDLAEAGFESFVNTETGVEAYVELSLFDEEVVKGLVAGYEACETYTLKEVEEENWNAVWEENFQPITVDDKVAVRATFHAPFTEMEHEIIIDPRMSFGTGHHQTTHLMISEMLSCEFEGKSVLDMGAGTAVLGILAEKLGASDVLAIDIDEWAYNNAKDNLPLNNSTKITVMQGTSTLLQDRLFNTILANINLNVLLSDMQVYVSCLKSGGEILFSGVLEHDLDKLKNEATKAGLELVSARSRDKWQMLRFFKN